ncbi:MAG: FAD-dependent oxidoreductase, partial [Alphaproteobacteria bacterium]
MSERERLPAEAPAVVIGGGVVGCSILYHLARLGWTDAVLLERDELTSGSTWHAAANLHGLHDDNTISRLQYYTIRLYRELEAETGQGCGVFQPGSIYLARTEAREDQLRLQVAKARRFGVDFREISREEALELHPLLDLDGVRYLAFEADGGNVDPSGVTAAYAAGARARGARVFRFTPVRALERRADGRWRVITGRGEIVTDWVVNAAGLWAREVAAMAGLHLPLQPTEHQYFVTEPIPAIAALGRRLPSVADRDGEYYLRQEGQGVLIGAYEREPRLWAEAGTPADFGHELFPDDLDRIGENVMRALATLPAAAEAGIRRVINGPMIWSPDAAALFGPVPELGGFFCCCGIIPGFSQSGGLGLMAAQWMIEGEPAHDLWAWDLARFDDWADGAFTRARVRDVYAHRFKIHFPYEERAAGRPVRTRPAYGRQKALGAVFGLSNGWEHPLWYAPAGVEPVESYGFRRQPWEAHVRAEGEALRSRAGLIDISNFARYRLRGPGAADWLARVVAGRVPREIGRMSLAPALNARAGVVGDFTIACLGEEDYLILGSGVAERRHRRLWGAVPRPEGLRFESVTRAMAGFAVAGPEARRILAAVVEADLGPEAFPFFRARRARVAGIEAVLLRVSFTGDLGWEIHVAEADQPALMEALLAAGAPHGLRLVGSRALMNLRLEKGYPSWGREISSEYRPQELGMERLIRPGGGFLHAGAWERVRGEPPRERLALLEIAADAADASGGEPVFDAAGRPVGRVTSGGWGPAARASLAFAMLAPEAAAPGT